MRSARWPTDDGRRTALAAKACALVAAEPSSKFPLLSAAFPQSRL